jgi:hypothetical protein
MTRLSPTAVLSRLEGYLDVDLARAFLRYYDELFATTDAKVLSLNDWSKLEGYATESRKMFTRWTDDHRNRFTRILIYTESRIVRMGIATANIILGSLVEATGSRVEFEGLIGAAKAGRV